MFTALYQFKDSYGCMYYRNCKIGGFKTKAAAIRAVKRMSPKQTGLIQIGQSLISIVVNGRETTANIA